MLETVLSYLREQLDGQKKVELNLCLALLSKYFIEGDKSLVNSLTWRRNAK